MKKLHGQEERGQQDNMFSEGQSEITEELPVLQNKIVWNKLQENMLGAFWVCCFYTDDIQKNSLLLKACEVLRELGYLFRTFQMTTESLEIAHKFKYHKPLELFIWDTNKNRSGCR